MFWTTLFGVIACGWMVQSWRASWGMLRLPWLTNAPPISADAAPSISIVFAARDEAEGLPAAIASLLRQDYPNYEVIAVNDRSRDATGAILREAAHTSPRLKVVTLEALPAGWLGKPHALWNGAQEASGEWLVFTDADVEFEPETLRRAVGLAIERGWEHLTLLAGIDMRGFWETTLLTYFTMGFAFGNEVWRVADRKSERYAGVGAFQMLRRTTYDAIGGHRALAMEVVDDMRLGKLVKRGGFSSGVGIARDEVHLHWYPSAGAMVRGLTKNMFAALNFSLPAALGNIALGFGTSILPFLGIFLATGWARWFALLAAAVAVGFQIGVAVTSKVSPLYALTQPIGAAIFLYIIARSTAVTLARGGVTWRGDFYPIEELRRGSV